MNLILCFILLGVLGCVSTALEYHLPDGSKIIVKYDRVGSQKIDDAKLWLIDPCTGAIAMLEFSGLKSDFEAGFEAAGMKLSGGGK